MTNKREVECGVMQQPDGTALASVVGEIRTDGLARVLRLRIQVPRRTSTNIVPADIPTTVAERVRDYAVKAFEAVGGEGFARVDFFLTGGDNWSSTRSTRSPASPRSRCSRCCGRRPVCRTRN